MIEERVWSREAWGVETVGGFEFAEHQSVFTQPSVEFVPFQGFERETMTFEEYSMRHANAMNNILTPEQQR